jgi:hypothetical protein
MKQREPSPEQFWQFSSKQSYVSEYINNEEKIKRKILVDKFDILCIIF